MRNPDDLDDDDLGNAVASPSDAAYECGWHDGCDYGYRLARRELDVPDAGSHAMDPPFNSREVAPGDLCRATMYDDPAIVAAEMAQWFDDIDRCAAAAAWLSDVADRIGEMGRG